MAGRIQRFLSELRRETDGEGEPRLWYPLSGHLLAMLATALVAILLSRFRGTTGLVGISLAITLTALALGGSIGFLFAIPRVASQVEMATAAAVAAQQAVPSGPSNEKADAPSPQQKQQANRLMTTNNNLEKVSDWLTTMLVGVGLTQLGNIDGALFNFRMFLARSARLYPDDRSDPAGLLPMVGPMLLVAGLAIGFVYFYVFTRVVIAPKLFNVEKTFDKGGQQTVRTQQDVETIKSVAEALPVDNKATRAVATAAAPSVDDAMSVMYDALYQQGGWQDAIRVARALEGTDAIRRPEYWFYLAAAQGQRFKAATSDAERATARVAALAAATRAVELSPSYRGRLWQISDAHGYDDDLADFRSDPSFLAIVGRPTGGLTGASPPPPPETPSVVDPVVAPDPQPAADPEPAADPMPRAAPTPPAGPTSATDPAAPVDPPPASGMEPKN